MRTNFRGETIRIGFVDRIPSIVGDHVIFVYRALTEGWYKALPHSGRAGAHHVGPGIPLVEIAHYRDLLGIRGPYRKLHSLTSIPLREVGAEFLVGMIESSLGQQIYVKIAQRLQSWHHGLTLPLLCLQLLCLHRESQSAIPRHLEVVVEIALGPNPPTYSQNVRRKTLRRQFHIVARTLPQIAAFAQ